jgi:stage III sporulation protein AB
MYFSSRLKKREETLLEFAQIFREMALLIRHRTLPVNDLFAELSRYEFIERIASTGDDFRGSWASVTNTLTELEEGERDIIKSVGRALGTSDVDGQLSMLEVNTKLLCSYSEAARELYSQKGKLYRTCGILTGLFMAILII